MEAEKPTVMLFLKKEKQMSYFSRLLVAHFSFS